MAYELLRDHACIVFYKAARPSLPGEWDKYLDFVGGAMHFGNRLRFFTYNEDGEFPREHQNRLTEMMRGYSHRVSVISPSAIMRFIASMFMMMNRQLRLFAPTQLEEAYAHLECDDGLKQAIAKTLDELRARVA